MRTLVHLSDLDFDSIDPAVVQPLIDSVEELSPNLVAVSGDLTQRAEEEQFKAAHEFLNALPGAKIVVPGNHDVPLYRVYARFHKLERYRRYITEEDEPFYADAELAVLGVGTARSPAFSGRRIKERQIEHIIARLCSVENHVIKVVVTNDPFDLPEQSSDLVGRAAMAMERLAGCDIDLFLAGHFRIGLAAPTTLRLHVSGRSALVVQAGAVISTRRRSEPNSFNVIRIDPPFVSIERFDWQSLRGAFVSGATDHFRHTANGWQRVPPEQLN